MLLPIWISLIGHVSSSRHSIVECVQDPYGVHVGEGVEVGDADGLGVGDGETRGVAVGVGEGVGVCVTVGVGVGVGGMVDVAVAVGVGLILGVAVEVAVGVLVGTTLGLGDTVGVGVTTGLWVAVGVGCIGALGFLPHFFNWNRFWIRFSRLVIARPCSQIWSNAFIISGCAITIFLFFSSQQSLSHAPATRRLNPSMANAMIVLVIYSFLAMRQLPFLEEIDIHAPTKCFVRIYQPESFVETQVLAWAYLLLSKIDCNQRDNFDLPVNLQCLSQSSLQYLDRLDSSWLSFSAPDYGFNFGFHFIPWKEFEDCMAGVTS
jgi:hypothetical protein